jgi:uncharacterized protein YjbI with pentapeptide repeats
MTEGCVLRLAVLRYCHIPVQVIESFHPDLYGVTFSGLNLKGAKFARLDISCSKFDKCTLDDSDFTECTAGEARRFFVVDTAFSLTLAPFTSNCQCPAALSRPAS